MRLPRLAPGFVIPGFALVLAALPRAATAQTPADSALLVQAVSEALGDSFIRQLQGDRNTYLEEPVSRFDAWVMRRLQDAHGLPLMPTGADTATWVGTRGFAVDGDTAAVMVELGTRSLPSEGIHTYIETHRFLFVRAPEGWRFVRREFVRGVDMGNVRG